MLGVDIRNMENVTSDIRNVVFNNLDPFTNYTASIRAITGNGTISGVSAMKDFTTSVGSKFVVLCIHNSHVSYGGQV